MPQVHAGSVIAVHAEGKLFLVGPPSAFPFGMAVAAPPFEHTVRAIARHAPQIAHLRAHSSGSSPVGANDNLADWLVGQIDCRRLAVVHVPDRVPLAPSGGPAPKFSVPDIFLGNGAARSQPKIDVRTLSGYSKITEMVLRSFPLLPSATRQIFLTLVSPTALTIMVASLAVWAGSHAVGVGELVDLALLGIGYAMVGWSVFEGLETMLTAVRRATAAEKPADLDAAAEVFAQSLVQLGVNTVMILLMRTRGKGIAAAEADAATVARWKLYLDGLEMNFDGSRAALWSKLGKNGAEVAAGRAAAEGRITLEMVLKETTFPDRYRAEFGRAETKTTSAVWQLVSEKFASKLRGQVTVYTDSAELMKAAVEGKEPQLGAELFEILDRPGVTSVAFKDLTDPSKSTFISKDLLRGAGQQKVLWRAKTDNLPGFDSEK